MSRWDGFKRVIGWPETRDSSLSLSEFAEMLTFNQINYPFLGAGVETLGAKQERISPTFNAFSTQIYKANPVVFGCMQARSALFCEARFKYRKDVDGRPGELFTTKSLKPLEEPWPEAATSDLLRRMINDVDLAGNFFGVKRKGGVERLRPDWVSIMLEPGYGELGAVPIGYIYTVGGRGGDKSYALLASEVAHWAPTQDPIFAYRGMSWLQPIIREVMADQAGTEHKLQYLEKGATPNAVIKPDPKMKPEDFQRFKEMFEERTGNAYGTLFLGGGADYEVVGNDMTKVDFKRLQALGENRICMAARVPAIIAGASEGLEAATYSNFASARRQFADGEITHLWKGACEALAPLITVPRDAELSFDDRDIRYLREDMKDVAETQRMQAEAAHRYFEAGFEPDSITEALEADDISRLKHSGQLSVQLQTSKGVLESNPKEEQPSPEGEPTNGKGNPNAVPVPAKGEGK